MPVIDCAAVRDQIEALVDGRVPGSREAELTAHLAACGACGAHHAEARSLPTRLSALRSPEPPPTLVPGVLRRVRGSRVSPVQFWGLLAAEVLLSLVALWYVSGLAGLYGLVARTASDVGAVLGWGIGQSDPPAPPAGDVFLLLLCGLLAIVAIYHLNLLSRHEPQWS